MIHKIRILFLLFGILAAGCVDAKEEDEYYVKNESQDSNFIQIIQNTPSEVNILFRLPSKELLPTERYLLSFWVVKTRIAEAFDNQEFFLLGSVDGQSKEVDLLSFLSTSPLYLHFPILFIEAKDPSSGSYHPMLPTIQNPSVLGAAPSSDGWYDIKVLFPPIYQGSKIHFRSGFQDDDSFTGTIYGKEFVLN